MGDTTPLDVDAVGRRVETLLEQVAAADPATAALAEELVAELLGLYGAGLSRLLGRLEEARPGAVGALADDPLLAGLLVLHDLHPTDVRDRIEAALDECRPYLGSHGGGVTLIDVTEDGVVRLRLEGTCDGCGASESTLKNAVEEAVMAAAPEVTFLDVEGVASPDEGHAPPPGGPPRSLAEAGRRQLPVLPRTTG